MNIKPAKDFDNKYGTSISQEWTFPLGYTADEVYALYEQKPNSEFSEIVGALTKQYFPYDNVENLDDLKKTIILAGMASGFNYDDIVHFAIDGFNGDNNKEVDEIIMQKFPPIMRRCGWVMSMNTCLKVLAHIDKELKRDQKEKIIEIMKSDEELGLY